eukprot:661639-Amphidinium_carterae.1
MKVLRFSEGKPLNGKRSKLSLASQADVAKDSTQLETSRKHCGPRVPPTPHSQPQHTAATPPPNKLGLACSNARLCHGHRPRRPRCAAPRRSRRAGPTKTKLHNLVEATEYCA